MCVVMLRRSHFPPLRSLPLPQAEHIPTNRVQKDEARARHVAVANNVKAGSSHIPAYAGAESDDMTDDMTMTLGVPSAEAVGDFMMMLEAPSAEAMDWIPDAIL